MEDNKRKIFIVVILLVIVLVGVGLVIKNIFFQSSHNYLFIKDTMLWEQNGDKWKQLNETNDDIFKQKYTLYDGVNSTKDVKLQKEENGWYYFSNNYKQIKPTNLRGLSNIGSIKFANYKQNFATQNDTEYITEALSQINVNMIDGYYTSKVTLDFDNDGNEESVYITSNYSFDFVNYKIYTVVYQVINGKVTQIIDKAQDLPYNFFEILDIDNDGKYEMILTYGVQNQPTLSSCYKMYKLNSGKWEVIKDCAS